MPENAELTDDEIRQLDERRLALQAQKLHLIKKFTAMQQEDEERRANEGERIRARLHRLFLRLRRN